MALTALVALTLFVWTQHQAILAQSLADQARHQQDMAQQALLQAPVPLPPPSPAPVVLTPVPVYVPPAVTPNLQPQPWSPDPGESLGISPRMGAEADRQQAESEMQTAMEPKQQEFPTTPEGQQQSADWQHQVMEDRAQAVSQLQTRIDHDNDVINGQGAAP